MKGVSAEDLFSIYKDENCYLERIGNTWCLTKNGKVRNRITSNVKAKKLLEYIEGTKGVDEIVSNIQTNNPFEIQMNKLKPTSTEVNTVSTTSSSPLLNRKKKDNKQIYSVKLQKELSDKLITLSLEENISFTDIIEYGLEKVFEELDVRIDKELVKKYNAQKGKKK